MRDFNSTDQVLCIKANYILKNDETNRQEYKTSLKKLIQNIKKTDSSKAAIEKMLKEIKQFNQKD